MTHHHLYIEEGDRPSKPVIDQPTAAETLDAALTNNSKPCIDDLPTNETSVGGQDQASEPPTKSKFGEFWIEEVYKKRSGKTYGPYRVQRWRDENGKKRSRYLGKAQKMVNPDT
jgi:hypothetical protein